MASINSSLCEEISHIVSNHLIHLEKYLPAAKELSDEVPESVLTCAEHLAEICQTSPRTASYELYCEACRYQDSLQAFLETMNQRIDSDFRDTHIGRVFLQARTWRRIADRNFQITLDEAWDMIAPAMPDHLEELGDGHYEARWWKPVPVMDLEILKYTEGVNITGKPFEPKELPGGLALRFSLSTEVKRDSA